MTKPTLLLHACCAPCSGAVIERLCADYELTLLYYNPNIHPQDEWLRRYEELVRFVQDFLSDKGNGIGGEKIALVGTPYSPQDFYEATHILTDPEVRAEKERGTRCERCYELRLRKTQEYAYTQRFDYFCTTLTVSPHKDAAKINAIGKKLAPPITMTETSAPPRFLEADFKKKDGYKRSLELSAQYGLYRQNYCGCCASSHPCDNEFSQAKTLG
ncbi:MAG: epoxyqueuosine reductase QueH [Treponemataceae bacterium]|nr:MAG: epoxyqueuosine reductase QueH [Treponemataceae bacterium]